MNQHTDISSVYLIGIGGIGMSALAQYFVGQGARVSGYDRAPSAITDRLRSNGVAIQFNEDISAVDRDAQLIVYTPAIPKHHAILEWYIQHGYNVKKRSEVLAGITADQFNICIAGTHGKTTISIMTAHLLRDTGYGCNAFLGGISTNYQTNYWDGKSQVNVIEADEYDRSFLRLRPDVAVISAIEPDHLDVYGSREHMESAFYQFAGLVAQEQGTLVSKFGVSLQGTMPGSHLTYSLQNASASVYASDIVLDQGGYNFNVHGPWGTIESLRLNMGGMYNVENMIAAIAVAKQLEIDNEMIRAAVSGFRGVHRRFEYVIHPEEAARLRHDVVLIDDYAHHPAELHALLKGVRALFNKRWITIIFQPHLYSRTRDFYKEFAAALGLANTVILMPVYPARELPLEGVDSEKIADAVQGSRAMIKQAAEVLDWVGSDFISSLPRSLEGDVLIMAGAGDIDKLVQPVRDTINEKLKP